METISMSRKERARLKVFVRVKSGICSLTAASEELGRSYRQVCRSYRRFEELGDVGLAHQARGRPSNRQPDVELREKVLTLYREHYSDYGPTLASERLAADHQLEVSPRTLLKWLSSAGLWKRQRKGKTHRRRRARRVRRGELVQMDGSNHAWFEGRRKKAVLMVMIDDATGRVFARFFEVEDWAAAVEMFVRYVARYGLPRALYVDRHAIYHEEQGETQFGRAMRELGVRLIPAGSPQAKGRVERMNRTLQDRLVKALRRANISDVARANAFLEEEFLPDLNERFGVPSASDEEGHVSLPADVDLERILAYQELRKVQADWTVRWKNAFLQLPRKADVKPKQQVMVCEQRDGRIRVFAGDRELAWSATRSEPVRRRPRRSSTGPTASSQGHKPSPSHPWRNGPRPA